MPGTALLQKMQRFTAGESSRRVDLMQEAEPSAIGPSSAMTPRASLHTWNMNYH